MKMDLPKMLTLVVFLLALAFAVPGMTFSYAPILLALLGLGLVMVAVTIKERSDLLLAVVALSVTGGLSFLITGGGDFLVFVDTFLQNMLIAFVPATIGIALLQIFHINKSK